MSDKVIPNPILGAPHQILWPVTGEMRLAIRVDTYRLEWRGIEYRLNEWAVYNGDCMFGIYTSERNARPNSRGMITLTLVRDPVLDNMR